MIRVLTTAGIALVVIAAGLVLASMLQTGPQWTTRPRSTSALFRWAWAAVVLAWGCAFAVAVLRGVGR